MRRGGSERVMRRIGVRAKIVYGLPALFAAFCWAGCGGPKPESNGGAPVPAESKAPPASGEKSGVRAALVLDTGGVDDKSFNAAAWAGLQRATKDLGAEGKYVESKSESDYKTNLTLLANQNYDII